ncbi:alpha/beta fold hydrolase [Agrobacterium rosae]|uniref:Alpha/beta hydrolase n=1 Tax=Agrobacterium rosae TaxID=1972867 RepID=A0AAE5RV52_9HYPH|nr:alpha/beta hydrolase [Agrobacterium rosae]KAA3515408.1 alpha/beta hydrolase [Agrobacterium rosae]KAA3524374.1 alpha/beta hydrolase [Agrobacterium rosae]MBN7804332.1 alpha/beta hydrolase [Agrobacterium rosae]MCM2431275.1 alpha/beta hydrolase [Agrobacterium rosae]MDX8302237.1 alpha/beta hydrolase [Agrobacterium rosae]
MHRRANDLFPGFKETRIETPDVDFAVLTAGTGPAILLLHGYPETRTAWHRIAPALADAYTVVIPDLPGYGDSRTTGNAQGMGSKRHMAKNLHEMMFALGHRRFVVIGHDRGGRVAYRMALDFTNAVTALVSVTVVPTPEMWEGASKAFGMGAWHWFMMAQPAPLPETLMAADPRFLIDLTLGKMAENIELIDPLALEDYRLAFDNPDVRHAMCEDYRAGATVDEADDLADRTSGRKIQVPVLVLWEKDRLYGGGRKPLDIWADWATEIEGKGIGGGHLLPETAAVEVLEELRPFLRKTANAP